MAALEEERTIARGHAAIGVTRGITDSYASVSTIRPATTPSATVRTSILPIRKRASPVVSTGISARSTRGRSTVDGDFIPFARSLGRAHVGLEWVGEVLGLAGHLAIQELHDAHRIGRLTVIHEDEL